MVVASVTDADYTARIANDTLITERSHVLRVPEATVADTTTILGLHKPALEREYSITINEKARAAPAVLAKRYLGQNPLPAAVVQLMHRVGPWLCAWELSRTWPSGPSRPQVLPTIQRWTKRTCWWLPA